MAPLKRIDSPSRVDQVWGQLRRAILHGQILAGERLVELEIAARLGTSQGPVREALQRLEHEGLVTRVAHTGTFVSPLAYDEMRDVIAVRAEVESCAIRLTAAHITAAQCDDLTALIDTMRASGQTGDMGGLGDNDMALHERICLWSGHATLLRVWRLLYVQVQRFINLTHPYFYPDLRVVADQHIPLVEALREHDQELAARRMREHIMLVWSNIEASGPPPPLMHEDTDATSHPKASPTRASFSS
jgi:DNA-binding GntR family transcriptional regulator